MNQSAGKRMRVIAVDMDGVLSDTVEQFISWEERIIKTYLHIEITDIGRIEHHTGRQVAVEELAIELVGKFKIGGIDAFIGPAYIKAKRQ